ncbi:MAG TPA: hypothetical protein VLA19_28135 [Herpetosiphonaceae bacterium]|nr:hypothetical protein [Herpetosiphonaceae bacterium]
MTTNTLPFLIHVCACLRQAHLDVCLFGGWAEEVWGLAPPRSHGDIDLLYPAAHFGALDRWIAMTPQVTEIHAKRFRHKRAVMYHAVMIEWLLVERQGGQSITRFWDGRHTFVWPPGPLASVVVVERQPLNVARPEMLHAYHQAYDQREQAYYAYLREQRHR